MPRDRNGFGKVGSVSRLRGLCFGDRKGGPMTRPEYDERHTPPLSVSVNEAPRVLALRRTHSPGCPTPGSSNRLTSARYFHACKTWKYRAEVGRFELPGVGQPGECVRRSANTR